jgi:hypothetical protein
MTREKIIFNEIRKGNKWMVTVYQDGKAQNATFFNNRDEASKFVLYWNKKRDKHVHAELTRLTMTKKGKKLLNSERRSFNVIQRDVTLEEQRKKNRGRLQAERKIGEPQKTTSVRSVQGGLPGLGKR